MFKIDFIDNSHVNGTINFTYDYDALLIALNLVNHSDIDYSVFIENYIEPEDTINDSDNTYRVELIRDPRYVAFLRDLNCAIIDSRPIIIDGIDSYDGSAIKQLIVNDEIVGTTNHISDETSDMIMSSHIFDYSDQFGESIDFDSITIYDIKTMLDRFIDIVAMMNNEN